MKRVFVEGGLGGDFTLGGAEHNHLANVLRVRVGEEVVVICGDEFDYHYSIESIGKREARLRFIKKELNKCNPRVELKVFLGAIKADNISLVVQKLNEIGASEVVLFRSAFVQNVPVNIDRLNSVARQSCKQCGRSIPLRVSGVLGFEEMQEQLPKCTFFADEKEAGRRLGDGCGQMEGEKTLGLVIGCEGGFTDSEREALCKRARAVTLGSRILRAESAAICAASVLLCKMGEF